MIAAIYARKSKADEASLDRQVDLCRDFIAKQPGWQQAAEHVYSDDGVSGATDSRPGLDALLRAVDTHAVDAVVMMNVDRLSRGNIATSVALQQRIVDAGCQLWFYQTGQRVLLETATDELKASIDAYGARDFRDQIKLKTAAALRKKAQAAHATGNRVYGYRAVAVAGATHKVREVYEPEATIVRRLFTAYAAGRGLRGLGKDLTAAGVPGPRGNGWSPATLRDLLANPLYKGEVIYGKTGPRPKGAKKSTRRPRLPEHQWTRVAVPALQIVPVGLWESAQARRADLAGVYLRAQDGTLQSKPLNAVEAKHLLTGLLACGVCGGPMGVGARTKAGQRSVFLRCRRNNDKGARACANGRTIPMALAESAILSAVEAHLAEDVLYGYLYRIGQPPAPDALAAQRTVVTTALVEATKAVDNLVAAVAQGGGALPSLLAALKTAERQKADLTRTLAGLEQAVAQPRWNPEQWGKKVEEAAKGWQHLATLKPELARAKLAKLLGGARLTVTPPDAQGIVRFSGELSVEPILAALQLPRFHTPPAAVTRTDNGGPGTIPLTVEVQLGKAA